MTINKLIFELELMLLELKQPVEEWEMPQDRVENVLRYLYNLIPTDLVEKVSDGNE
jgi:hypothetical protein